MRLAAAVACVLVTATLAMPGTAGASAGVGTVTDPDEVPGLDIASATLSMGDPVVFEVKTYEALPQTGAEVLWFLTLDDGQRAGILAVGNDGTGYHAELLVDDPTSQDGPAPKEEPLLQPDATTVRVSIPLADLGSPTKIDYDLHADYDRNGDGEQQKEEYDVLPDSPKEDLQRLAGADRLGTAIAISQAGFDDGQAGVVVLARANDYADALAGSPLAARSEGPLLLTPTEALDSRVEHEIGRVLPKGSKVYLLGGATAIGPEVEQRLTALGYQPVRLAGGDRFETAVRIAQEIGSPESLFLTTGRGFADALSTGPAAGLKGGAVLLTDGTTLPPSVKAYIDAHPDLQRWAVGGPAAAADPGAVKIAGVDRYDTSRAVALAFFSHPDLVGLATGASYADALAGGASLGLYNGPLLLTAPDGLPDTIQRYLDGQKQYVTVIAVFGGQASVGASTAQAALAAVHVA